MVIHTSVPVTSLGGDSVGFQLDGTEPDSTTLVAGVLTAIFSESPTIGEPWSFDPTTWVLTTAAGIVTGPTSGVVV